MILKYRGQAHADNECDPSIEKMPAFGERGRRIGITERWTIRGFLTASTQSALTTALNTLEARYAVDGGDLILYLSDGSTESAHSMRSKESLGGTRVTKGVSYPNGKGAEYSEGFGRTYEVVVEADFAESDENLLTWQQQISRKGVAGAEKWVYVPILNGDFDRQTVNMRVPVTVVQRGSAIGQFRHPVPPPPIWPRNEHRELREIDPKSPTRKGNDLTAYEISWSYTFESITPLNGSGIVP